VKLKPHKIKKSQFDRRANKIIREHNKIIRRLWKYRNDQHTRNFDEIIAQERYELEEKTNELINDIIEDLPLAGRYERWTL